MFGASGQIKNHLHQLLGLEFAAQQLLLPTHKSLLSALELLLLSACALGPQGLRVSQARPVGAPTFLRARSGRALTFSTNQARKGSEFDKSQARRKGSNFAYEPGPQGSGKHQARQGSDVEAKTTAKTMSSVLGLLSVVRGVAGQVHAATGDGAPATGITWAPAK